MRRRATAAAAAASAYRDCASETDSEDDGVPRPDAELDAERDLPLDPGAQMCFHAPAPVHTGLALDEALRVLGIGALHEFQHQARTVRACAARADDRAWGTAGLDLTSLASVS